MNVYAKPKPALVLDSPAEKARHRAELQRATAEFLERGGAVQRVGGAVQVAGVTAAPHRGFDRVWDGAGFAPWGG